MKLLSNLVPLQRVGRREQLAKCFSRQYFVTLAGTQLSTYSWNQLSGRFLFAYYELDASKPGIQEWQYYLGQAGYRGGCSDTRAERSQADVSQTLNWIKAAMEKRARRSWVQRAIPTWGVPRNLWRSLFWPRLGVRMQGWGGGYNVFKYDHMGTLFRQCICTMFALVWCYDQMPVDWVSAQVCTFDKKHFKVGCEEARFINIVEEIGNRYVGHLLQSWVHRWISMYASGYQLGSLRVEAAIHQWGVAHQES